MLTMIKFPLFLLLGNISNNEPIHCRIVGWDCRRILFQRGSHTQVLNNCKDSVDRLQLFMQNYHSIPINNHFIIHILHVTKPALEIESASSFRTKRPRSISVHRQLRLTINQISSVFLTATTAGKVSKLSPDQCWDFSCPSHSRLWFKVGRPSSQLPEERQTPSLEYPIPTSRRFSLRI